MKKFVILSLLALLALPLTQKSFALPIPANAEKRMNLGDVRGPGVQLGYQVMSNKEQVLRCRYDASVLGGSSAAAITLKAVDGSDCFLPKSAIVTSGIIDVITMPTSIGSATIALGTGQAANDLKTAAAISGFTIGELNIIPVYTAATAIKLTANRNPIITIAVAPITTGKFDVYIKWLMGSL